jgi:hypothetical protein
MVLLQEMGSVYCYGWNEFTLISGECTRALSWDVPLCYNFIVHKLVEGRGENSFCEEIQHAYQPSFPHVTGFRVMRRNNFGNRAEHDTNRRKSVGS